MIYFITFSSVQLLLLVFLASKRRNGRDLHDLLLSGVFIGVIIGIPFDLYFGATLGLFSYGLGFGPISILLNAFVLYGIFASQILLVGEALPFKFVSWVLLITFIYEAVNWLMPVWTWEFSLSSLLNIAFIIILYIGGSISVILMDKILARTRALRQSGFTEPLRWRKLAD